MRRSSGIIMPVFSLPSPYGVGTMGRQAYEFADFLKKSGQSYWQVLPMGPTSFGDSPYQSFSSFAGNPYFVDLDELVKCGLLEKSEIESVEWGTDPRHIDYGRLYEQRFELLKAAKERGWEKDRVQIEEFSRENAEWLPDYAMFMALKRYFNMQPWYTWPDEKARMHESESLEKYRALLRNDVELFTYIQYLFFKQWSALKKYANSLGIKIIGDMPIYVASDSCDVWSQPRFFLLDEEKKPEKVAGVPPDYFSEQGQLWGNPLYDWDEMKADGYGWWIRRVGGASKLYDVIRIDHFRGFDSYWTVPAQEKTAVNGKWEKGPGMALVGMLGSWFNELEFIAEDLGEPSPDVKKLLSESGWPGMRVLEFAFASDSGNAYLPHNHVENCVCYTGTHDNSPLALWKIEAEPEELSFAEKYTGAGSDGDFCLSLIRLGMSSVARLFVAQMQDWLELGDGSRTNTPGTAGGNWQWRMLPDEADDALAGKIYEITKIYGRI